jgi:hypothetical protein
MKRWTWIVTTAPRKECSLKATCESLELCGWKPVIFAEPGSTNLADTYETYFNGTRLGIWRNWMHAARWALATDAEYIMTVQDDVDFHPETKDWLDEIKWPHDTGFISPYTPKHYQLDKKSRLKKRGLLSVITRSCWTGQSLCFKREVIEKILKHDRAINWTGLPPKERRNPKGRVLDKEIKARQPWLIQNSDFIIGSILQLNLGLKLYYPNPSLATHSNPHSSVNHGSNVGRRNAYYVAKHDLPIKEQLDPNFKELT